MVDFDDKYVSMYIIYMLYHVLLKYVKLNQYEGNNYLYYNSPYVSKLQVAIIARSSREMSQTVRIDRKHILSRVRVSFRHSIYLYAKNPQNYREYRVANATVYLSEAPTGHSSPAEQSKGWHIISSWLGAHRPIEQR